MLSRLFNASSVYLALSGERKRRLLGSRTKRGDAKRAAGCPRPFERQQVLTLENERNHEHRFLSENK